jgi:hypothetical protein
VGIACDCVNALALKSWWPPLKATVVLTSRAVVLLVKAMFSTMPLYLADLPGFYAAVVDRAGRNHPLTEALQEAL